jgi:PAS domain S-box-containing protein/putative nucleotidyltransferase with HDIG domain
VNISEWRQDRFGEGIGGNRRKEGDVMRKSVLEIVFFYVLIAGVYILLSDQALHWLMGDRDSYTWLQTYKGWGFVLVTALLLYFVLSRRLTILEQLHRLSRQVTERLQHYLRVSPAISYALKIEGDQIRQHWVSENIQAQFGYTLEEALLPNWWVDHLHPDDKKQAQENFLSIFEKGSVNHQYRFLCKDGKFIWVQDQLRLIHNEGNGSKEVVGVWIDITDRKAAEERLKETLNRLRKAIGTTIQVMVSATEVRDPCTAGHQRRVADLARAIATEMKLSPDNIEAIRLAGPIHDIGKLSIPSEILSKPTRLTNIEFSMVKDHARIGFEILKGVSSPWPLAKIVYQHHERMNGSGYPENLKGDEILLEARILAVSDVVESMSSHRPYRPALGIEAALDEIEKNRGTLYDNAAADACLRLFREKGYQFKTY